MTEPRIPAKSFLWFVARYAFLKRSAGALRRLARRLEHTANNLYVDPPTPTSAPKKAPRSKQPKAPRREARHASH